jgi:hypothetical protein
VNRKPSSVFLSNEDCSQRKNYLIGDFEGNRKKIIDALPGKNSGADLVMFSELCLWLSTAHFWSFVISSRNVLHRLS